MTDVHLVGMSSSDGDRAVPAGRSCPAPGATRRRLQVGITLALGARRSQNERAKAASRHPRSAVPCASARCLLERAHSPVGGHPDRARLPTPVQRTPDSSYAAHEHLPFGSRIFGSGSRELTGVCRHASVRVEQLELAGRTQMSQNERTFAYAPQPLSAVQGPAAPVSRWR